MPVADREGQQRAVDKDASRRTDIATALGQALVEESRPSSPMRSDPERRYRWNLTDAQRTQLAGLRGWREETDSESSEDIAEIVVVLPAPASPWSYEDERS